MSESCSPAMRLSCRLMSRIHSRCRYIVLLCVSHPAAVLHEPPIQFGSGSMADVSVSHIQQMCCMSPPFSLDLDPQQMQVCNFAFVSQMQQMQVCHLLLCLKCSRCR